MATSLMLPAGNLSKDRPSPKSIQADQSCFPDLFSTKTHVPIAVLDYYSSLVMMVARAAVAIGLG